MVEVERNGDTLRLTAEVDISEATEAQDFLYEGMAELFGERYELFVRKNLSYGNSFVVQAVKDYIDNPSQYNSVTHAILDNLDTRIADKDNRAKNILNGGPELVGEDYSETVRDAMVYRAMQDFTATNGEELADRVLPDQVNVNDQ